MRKRQNSGTYPILAHEQPACEALFDFVKTVTSRDLRCSKRLEVHVTA